MGELVLGIIILICVLGITYLVINAMFNAVLVKLLYAESDPELPDALYFFLVDKDVVTKAELLAFLKDWENAR